MGAYIVLEMVNFTSLGTLRHDFGSLLFPLFPHTSDVDPQPHLSIYSYYIGGRVGGKDLPTNRGAPRVDIVAQSIA